MHNGEQVLYLQQLKIKRSLRLGILTKYQVRKLAEIQPIAMLPERHEVKYVECVDCKEYGLDEDCIWCHGKGELQDDTYHCGVEGCYQCEIWPLQ